MENDHKDAIDKVLSALSSAAPPEDMEARITQRLQHHATATPAVLHWRERFAGSGPTAAWWRGAISGAAAATLLACVVLLVQHRTPATPATGHTAVVEPRATANAVQAAAQPSPVRANPCASPSLIQVHRVVTPHSVATLRATNAEATHPAPTEPLTPQERALVRLAQTADPKQLAILNPETQAKLEAEDAAEFEKFFTPPPPPKTAGENE